MDTICQRVSEPRALACALSRRWPIRPTCCLGHRESILDALDDCEPKTMTVDGFFEWRAERGSKQHYAIAMTDRSLFGLAGLWENWKDPERGDWVRTFCIITTAANDLVIRIHDRMSAMLRPEDYARWLSEQAPPADPPMPTGAERKERAKRRFHARYSPRSSHEVRIT